MPKLNARRQITLPVEACRLAGIEPGDDYVCLADGIGRITVLKRVAGSASGILKDVPINKSISDEESRQSSLDE